MVGSEVHLPLCSNEPGLVLLRAGPKHGPHEFSLPLFEVSFCFVALGLRAAESVHPSFAVCEWYFSLFASLLALCGRVVVLGPFLASGGLVETRWSWQ